MVGFNPTSYTVREGSSTELTIMRIGDAEADVEVIVTTSGRTATGQWSIVFHALYSTFFTSVFF